MKEKRILLCRLGGIGDVVQTLPLVKYLKKKYPSASIEYLTSQMVADLLKSHCPYIDKVWVYDKKNKRQVASNISKEYGKVECLINLHGSLSFYFFNLFFVKANKFLQYRKNNNFHAVINFAQTYDRNISAFELDSKTLIENESEEILRKYNLQKNKYICIVPGVGKSRTHRAWPFENWLSLTKKILFAEKDCKIIFLGGDDEKQIFEKWLAASREIEKPEDDFSIPGFKDRAVNLIGKLNLTDTANIISKSSKLISGDTGLLHLAGAFSKNVIGLYGPTLPKRTGPYTSSYKALVAKDCKCISGLWDLKKCKMTKLSKGFCMDSLTVDNVLLAISGEITDRKIESVV